MVRASLQSFLYVVLLSTGASDCARPDYSHSLAATSARWSACNGHPDCEDTLTIASAARLASQAPPVRQNAKVSLLQRSTRIRALDAAGLEVAVATEVPIPSWIALFGGVALLAVLFSTCTGYCWHKQGTGAACVCSGCCGMLFTVLAVALIGLKVYVMRMAGPEPTGAVAQHPIQTEFVVAATVPFTEAQINSPGPVHSAYMDGMQGSLDKQTGEAHTLKVTSLHAQPLSSMLLQDARAAAEHRLSLAYDVVEKDSGSQPPQVSPSAVAMGLETELQKAAQQHTSADAPQALQDIAAGNRRAVIDLRSADLKVNVSLRCEAKHQLNEDIRAAARIGIGKHKEEILNEADRHLQHATGLPLVLADRCNDRSEEEAMRLCLGPVSFWVDFVTEQAVSVPESDGSAQIFVCRLGCELAAKANDAKAKAMGQASSYLGGFELDDQMVSEIRCTPSLPAGQTCPSACS